MSTLRKQFLGRTLCRGPTNIGQAKLVCWIASTMGPKGMQHGHGEALQRGLN